MTLARFFVTRQEDGWLVTLEGRPLARHASRDAATDDAVAMAAHMGAMDHDADVMVEAVAGEPPELVWSFGQDPLPGPHSHEEASHVRRVQRAVGS